MRDIKFRVWDGEKIITENVVFLGKSGFAVDLDGMDWDFEFGMYGKPEFVGMQYTGLKDKNGVEIYEGDIIPYGGKNYAVEMCGPSWSFPGFVGQDYYGHDEPELQDWSYFEVIGNIHQNPELLGE